MRKPNQSKKDPRKLRKAMKYGVKFGAGFSGNSHQRRVKQRSSLREIPEIKDWSNAVVGKFYRGGRGIAASALAFQANDAGSTPAVRSN